MRALVALGALLLSFVCSPVIAAGSVPALNPGNVCVLYANGTNSGVCGTDSDFVCKTFTAAYGAGYSGYASPRPSICYRTFNGSYDNTQYAMAYSLSCPAHSAANNATGNCACDSGYHAEGGSCVVDPPDGPCANTLAKPLGSAGQEFTYPVSGKSVPSKICQGSCTYIPRGAASAGAGFWKTLNGSWWYVGQSAFDWIGDGTSCTAAPVGSPGNPPDTPPQPLPDPPPKGTCPGTVNGVAVNVPCDSTSSSSGTGSNGSAPGSAASGPPSSASSPPGATPGASQQDKETTCTGSSCTTTTTTTTHNGDGTTTTQTDTKTEDKGDYCSEHPSSAQCADESSGDCKNNPDLASCAKLDTPATPAINGVTIPIGFPSATPWGADNGTCPAKVHTSSLGDVDPFALFCTYASGIRFAVIGFAFIVAVMIFLGRTD